MGQIASYFKRRENDDFETILNELEDSIRTKEENLAFIKQRERRAIVLFTSYSILIWLLYALAWWFGALDWYHSGSSSSIDDVDGAAGEHDVGLEGGDELLARIAKTIPVGAFPILIFFTRRIVKSWYTRKQNAENKQLTTLRKKQKDQIDKLKKLSNYDKITEMLERHGQVPPRASFGGATPLPGTPARNNKMMMSGGGGSAYSTPVGGGGSKTPFGFGPGQKTPFGFGPGQMQHLTPAQQKAVSTAQKKGQPIPPALMMAANANANPAAASNQKQQGPLARKMFPAPPAQPQLGATPLPPGMDSSFGFDNMTPPHQPKTFIDKIADALLGGDEQSPASKYALICQKCFAHNGLVLKDEVMDVQFVCPRCGHFNPSRRARMTGSSGLSRPSSGQGHHNEAEEGQERRSRKPSSNIRDGDDSIGGGGADESMALSSPTTHIHPALKQTLTNDKRGEQAHVGEGDVSMDLGDDEEGQGGQEQEDKLTSQMNADERREKLRKRTTTSSKKGGAQESDE